MSLSTHTPAARLPALAPPAAWASPSAWISFLAGGLTAFTVKVGGDLPVGEILLVAVVGWVAMCLAFHQAAPGPLLRTRLFRTLLAGAGIALAGYIFSDLYRQSHLRDMARGWSRLIFLAMDIVGVAYLFGRSRRNLVIFVLGQCAGGLASTALFGPLFGAYWKFGIGAPLTFLLFLLAPQAGPLAAVVAAAAMGAVHLVLGYRSLGGVCLLAAALGLLQMSTRRSRPWLAPLGILAVAGAIFWIYGHARHDHGERVTRSDIERSAMMTAAADAFARSPLIGQGSLFSNTDVYKHFLLLRQEAALRAHIGGFPEPDQDAGTTAVHSQILVSLAEGGLFGGAFFFVFGAALIWALYRVVFADRWHRLTPLATLLLLSTLWNLLFSPFSGAQRVYIAVACGLLLLLSTGRLEPAGADLTSDASA